MEAVILKPLQHRGQESLPRWIKKNIKCITIYIFY